jgi:hypothetical protein
MGGQKFFFLGIALSASLFATTSGACEEHWIRQISNHGHLIRLEDGSLWRIDSRDSSQSAHWLQFAEVSVCGGKLVNEDTREEIHAERIR